MKLAPIADKIAKRFYPNRFVNWDRLRDYVDTYTGGDLDCFKLDLLTDMVEARIKKETRQ